MKRRAFIQHGALALTGLALPGYGLQAISPVPFKGRENQKRVIIVGAGLSGLIAGYELKKSGHTVTLLEARAVPGGRVRTVREPFADDLYAEVGASRIHEDHSLVQHYCREFGLELIPFYPAKLTDLLDVRGKHRLFNQIGEQDYAHYNARFRHNIEDRLTKPIFKISGGMDQLPRALGRSLSQDIQYGAAVFKIEQDSKGVKAFFERGGENDYIEGDSLICTLPFSIVRHLEFTPGLSAEKSRAIFEMPYHSTCRILFQSRQRYWKASGLNGFAVYRHGEIWNPTFDQTGPRGVLAYYPGQYKVRNLGVGDRVAFGLKKINEFFPGIYQYVEGHYTQYWDEDPYALGAVSSPESIGTHLEHAKKPEGRIHFAGEHLSSQPRWMEGALESGINVAAAIIRN